MSGTPSKNIASKSPAPALATAPSAVSAPAAFTPEGLQGSSLLERVGETRALAILREAVAGADDGELFLEKRRGESLVFEDGRLKSSSFDASEGFGIRAVAGEVTGYAHSNEISEAALRRAAETAKLAARMGGGTLAAPPPRTNHALYAPEDPLHGVELAERIGLLEEIDTWTRGQDSKVVQVSVSLSASLQEIEILRPEGEEYGDIRPLCRLNVSVIVEKDGRRESGTAGMGGRYAVSRLMDPANWQKLAREALRIANVNLEAVPAPAGEMPVVLGPGWPGILLHEAIGHGLEGDFNRKGTSAFAGLMGKRVAAPGVTVVDDGTIAEARGSLNIDDEGMPTSRTVLIEDGILTGYMQDRQNARLMGMEPTGNGRRESYAHAPMPRMTNTIMLGGDADPADLVASLENGIWAVGFGGGQVDITSGKFVFSCTEAYKVENGKVIAPIKGATLIGDGPSVLKGVRGIGNDTALDPGLGTCGKAGQWVPVGVGQPSLLVEGLTVGGSSS